MTLTIINNDNNNQNEQYDHHQLQLINGLLGRANLLTMSMNFEEDEEFMEEFVETHPRLFRWY